MAPNFPALFNFEGNFEIADQAVLAAAGVTAYVTQHKAQLPLINADIAFSVDPAIDELTEIPTGPGWPADQPPPQEYFRYTGTLENRVEVARDKNGATVPGVLTLLEQVRGLIRGAHMRVGNPFTDVNLPYYRVTDIRPFGGGTITTDAARNVDAIVLRFRITFEIRNSAWPIS